MEEFFLTCFFYPVFFNPNTYLFHVLFNISFLHFTTVVSFLMPFSKFCLFKRKLTKFKMYHFFLCVVCLSLYVVKIYFYSLM